MMRVQALVTDEQYAKLNALAVEHKVEVSHVLQLLVATALSKPKKPPRTWNRMTDERIAEAAGYLNLGYSQSEIARAIGVARETVSNHRAAIEQAARAVS